MSIFFLAIMEKRSKEKYRFTTAKTISIPNKNQLLTETLLFIFAISVLSVNYLTALWRVDIPNVFLATILFPIPF